MVMIDQKSSLKRILMNMERKKLNLEYSLYPRKYSTNKSSSLPSLMRRTGDVARLF
jgi:hypothetical protein